MRTGFFRQTLVYLLYMGTLVFSDFQSPIFWAILLSVPLRYVKQRLTVLFLDCVRATHVERRRAAIQAMSGEAQKLFQTVEPYHALSGRNRIEDSTGADGSLATAGVPPGSRSRKVLSARKELEKASVLKLYRAESPPPSRRRRRLLRHRERQARQKNSAESDGTAGSVAGCSSLDIPQHPTADELYRESRREQRRLHAERNGASDKYFYILNACVAGQVAWGNLLFGWQPETLLALLFVLAVLVVIYLLPFVLMSLYTLYPWFKCQRRRPLSEATATARWLWWQPVAGLRFLLLRYLNAITSCVVMVAMVVVSVSVVVFLVWKVGEDTTANLKGIKDTFVERMRHDLRPTRQGGPHLSQSPPALSEFPTSWLIDNEEGPWVAVLGADGSVSVEIEVLDPIKAVSVSLVPMELAAACAPTELVLEAWDIADVPNGTSTRPLDGNPSAGWIEILRESKLSPDDRSGRDTEVESINGGAGEAWEFTIPANKRGHRRRRRITFRRDPSTDADCTAEAAGVGFTAPLCFDDSSNSTSCPAGPQQRIVAVAAFELYKTSVEEWVDWAVGTGRQVLQHVLDGYPMLKVTAEQLAEYGNATSARENRDGTGSKRPAIEELSGPAVQDLIKQFEGSNVTMTTVFTTLPAAFFEVREALRESGRGSLLWGGLELFTQHLVQPLWRAAGTATSIAEQVFDASRSAYAFVLQLLVFRQVLSLLLDAKGDIIYMGLRVLPLELDESTVERLDEVLSRTTRGVFVATFKVAYFHAFATWLLFTWFGARLKYVSVLVCTALSVVPVIPSFLIAIPDTIMLYSHSPYTALTFLALNFVLWFGFIDLAIYREIDSAPNAYITGLSVLGGFALFRLPGAVVGPMLICIPELALKVWEIYIAWHRKESLSDRTK